MNYSKIRMAVMLALLIIAQGAQAKGSDKDVTYLGGGRYACEGDCEKFDRQQKDRNRQVETQERYHRENRQDNQRIIDELKKGNQ